MYIREEALEFFVVYVPLSSFDLNQCNLAIFLNTVMIRAQTHEIYFKQTQQVW